MNRKSGARPMEVSLAVGQFLEERGYVLTNDAGEVILLHRPRERFGIMMNEERIGILHFYNKKLRATHNSLVLEVARNESFARATDIARLIAGKLKVATSVTARLK